MAHNKLNTKPVHIIPKLAIADPTTELNEENNAEEIKKTNNRVLPYPSPYKLKIFLEKRIKGIKKVSIKKKLILILKFKVLL